VDLRDVDEDLRGAGGDLRDVDEDLRGAGADLRDVDLSLSRLPLTQLTWCPLMPLTW
jgi:hypothetical protein